MAKITQDDLLDDGRQVREMVVLVQRFLDGAVGREELRRWARATSSSGQQLRFRRNGAAEGLHDCLLALDEKVPGTDEALIRRSELIEHLRRVRTGFVIIDNEVIAVINLGVAEITRRTGVESTRDLIPGLGWYDTASFASAGTGRAFFAKGEGPIDGPMRQNGTSIYGFRAMHSDAERVLILNDLFDTLEIDADDARHLCVRPPINWDLMRLDDNGITFCVVSFTGYAKARQRLARFESTHHKQSYWLESRQSREAVPHR